MKESNQYVSVDEPPFLRCAQRPGVVQGFGQHQHCPATILGKALAKRTTVGAAMASCDELDPLELPIKARKLVYIAGGSTERIEVAREWIRKAQCLGIEVVYDWTECESYEPGWPASNPHESWQSVAEKDFEAALAADIVWILMPEKLSEGAGTELGIALAARWFTGGDVFVVASGRNVHRNLFARLANAQFDAHEDALRYVAGLCGLRDGEAKELPQYTYPA